MKVHARSNLACVPHNPLLTWLPVCDIYEMYAISHSVEKNVAETVKWFRKAAEQKHAPAQASLGTLYRDGSGVEQSDIEAVNWFRLAAAQGHASGQFYLGMMYKDGRGVERNPAEAVKLIRMAADQGVAAAQKELVIADSMTSGGA